MSLVEIVEVGESPRPYPTPFRGVISGHAILYGYALVESSGAAGAEVDFIDGADANGLVAIPVRINAGESVRDWFGPQGIHFRGGLLPVVTGSIVGTMFIHIVGQDGRGR